MTIEQKNVGILIFEDVEVLDFAGPFEVFNVTAELNEPAPFHVYTIAESSAPVKTRGKLVIHPNYTIYNSPKPDILIVPGGAGSRALLKKPYILAWLQSQAETTERLCSVCTGALPLAKAGLFTGLKVTTHHDNLDDLQRLVGDSATVIRDRRYTDNGHILTSGGISAGIDMSLYIVRDLLGESVLAKTLEEMEYSWSPDTDLKWQQSLEGMNTD